MIVGEMLHRMSSKELTYWIAYHRVKTVEREMDASHAKKRQDARG
jgi:hypothetical protein